MEVFGFFFWFLVVIFSTSMFMNISSGKQQMEHGLADDIDSVFTQGDLSTLFADPSEINSTDHVELRNWNHTLAPVSVIDAAGNGYSGLCGPLGNSSQIPAATLPPNPNAAATFKSDQEQEQQQQQPQPEQQQEQQEQQQQQQPNGDEDEQQQQPNGDEDEQQQQPNGDDDEQQQQPNGDDDEQQQQQQPNGDEDEQQHHFCRLDEPRVHRDLRAVRGNRRRFNH